eukprot:2056797-Rhodomonas_salina.2
MASPTFAYSTLPRREIKRKNPLCQYKLFQKCGCSQFFFGDSYLLQPILLRCYYALSGTSLAYGIPTTEAHSAKSKHMQLHSWSRAHVADTAVCLYQVTRVTRIHNRFLRNRFEERLEALVDTSDGGRSPVPT